jgi:hypothetical protein
MFLQHGLPTKRRRPPGRYAIPDLTGFPVTGATPHATSLQIVSCGCYEQSVHALLQGMDAGTPQPQGFQASRLYGTGTDDPGDRNANVPGGRCLLGLGQLTGTKLYSTSIPVNEIFAFSLL